jgi:hypothetical protein
MMAAKADRDWKFISLNIITSVKFCQDFLIEKIFFAKENSKTAAFFVFSE